MRQLEDFKQKWYKGLNGGLPEDIFEPKIPRLMNITLYIAYKSKSEIYNNNINARRR